MLDRLVLDGEFLILDDGTIIPPDGFTPITAGPAWMQEVVGYKIGSASRARMAGLRYIGDRPMGSARALPWIAQALPGAAGLFERADRRGARNRHHGENRRRDRQREPRQDHRVGGRTVRPCRWSRADRTSATTYFRRWRRQCSISSPRRRSEAHPNRPG